MNVFKIMLKLKCITRLTILLVYLLIGAGIFTKLEKTDEPNAVVAERILTATRSRLSLRLGVNISDQDFFDSIKNITKAVALRGKRDWTFWNAFDFVFIALTTIGYGDMAPESELSQGVFIIYALIGLPITMITLKHTGLFLSEAGRHLITKFEKKILGISEPSRLELKCFIASLSAFIVGHLLMGYLYQRHSDVSYVEGIYAAFVTMTTIGFGDYRFTLFVDDDPRELLPVLVISRIPLVLFSLSIVACILSAPVDVFEFCQLNIKVQSKPNCNDLGEDNQENVTDDDRTTYTVKG